MSADRAHDPRFRVAWRDPRSGRVDYGEPADRATAEAWAKAMNRDDPDDVHYWVEPVPTPAQER